MIIINDLCDKSYCIFEVVTGASMKQLENSKETHYAFVGDTDCNISAASGAPIAINVKWRFECKKCA
jgi:hypothetical protein